MPDSTVVNWAEVADKALEMSKSAMVNLSETIQNIAPKAWEIAMRQVYAEAIVPPVGSLIVLLLVSFFVYKYNTQWKPTRLKEGKTENISYCHTNAWNAYIVVGRWVAAAAITILCFNLYLTLSHLGKVLINPEYYGIKKVMELAGM